MNEWQKVENRVQPAGKKMPESPPPIPEPEIGELPAQSAKRYTPGGRRRGMHPLAAPVGFLVLVLAAIGLVSIVLSGIHAVERATDDTKLRSELYDFLLPVMQYNPEAFADVNKSGQDALLLAAIWRVTEAERIRQLRDSSGISSYPIDDVGRMLIPVTEIEESYMELFGSGVEIYHHTIGDDSMSFTVEYDKAQGYYHIPSASPSSLYITVIDTLKKKGDKYVVRVGYVLSTKIGRDEKGEPVDPTPDMAEKFQLYTVRNVGGKGWKLVSITDEGPSGTAGTTAETAFDFDEDQETAETTNTASSSASDTTAKAKQSASK